MSSPVQKTPDKNFKLVLHSLVQMLIIPSLTLVYFFAQVNVLAVPVPFYRGVSFRPPAPSYPSSRHSWLG
ncbi:hypothetical protein BYT27DRAFT_6784259 [Phlegmacium glaucopus]|nr:hypothetical protein BYT27DRAFT_6784259 [Phlegmacium glaucopus]